MPSASNGFALPANTEMDGDSNSLLSEDDIDPYHELAGGEGFEPPYGGIKTRCLTAWRHPNLEINHQRARTAEAQPAATLSSKGESFNPRAKNASICAGASRAISTPRCIVPQSKNTQAPVPVRRADPNAESQSSARATSGYRRLTTPRQSFLPPDARKP